MQVGLGKLSWDTQTPTGVDVPVAYCAGLGLSHVRVEAPSGLNWYTVIIVKIPN